MQPPDSTLTPPLALRDTCQILREILGVYDASLVDEADRESDFAKVLDRAVDPVVEMCERMAEMRAVPSSGGGSSGSAAVPPAGSAGSTAEWEKDIFMVNCLGYLVVSPLPPRRCALLTPQHTLENWPFTTAKVERLEKMIQRHLESMTFEHVSRVRWNRGDPADESAWPTAGTVRPGSYHAHHSYSPRRRKSMLTEEGERLALTRFRRRCRGCSRRVPSRSQRPSRLSPRS